MKPKPEINEAVDRNGTLVKDAAETAAGEAVTSVLGHVLGELLGGLFNF